MNQAFEIGGVGLEAQQKALDVIANNIANLNTPAFKRADVQFIDLMAQRSDPDTPAAALGRSDAATAGVTARSVLAFNEQGVVEQTGKPMDLAINGEGFIELMGPHGQSLLWRGGTLRVQEDGLLAAGDGLALRATISVPTDATALQIDRNGIVSAQLDGRDARSDLGQIMLVKVDTPEAIQRLDGGYYQVPDGMRLTEATPSEEGAGFLAQGAIERSNVNINDELVRLMIVQRAYAANAQIVQAADQLAGIANGLRR